MYPDHILRSPVLVTEESGLDACISVSYIFVIVVYLYIRIYLYAFNPLGYNHAFQ